MNGKRPSSQIGSWNDVDVALLCVTCDKIGSTRGESHGRTFRLTADCEIHDGVRRESLRDNVNSVDDTSPLVNRAPSLRHLRHSLHGRKARRRFSPDLS